MDVIGLSLVSFIVVLLVFLVSLVVVEFIYNRIKNHNLLNLENYLPSDEIHSLRQLFYLMIMASSFLIILYSLIFWGTDLWAFTIFDFIISLYCCAALDKSTWKNRIFVFCLIPFGSLTYVLFGTSITSFLDLIHIPFFIYIIKLYFDKFNEYTESNGLGLSIILLFVIIFVSFLLTSFTEHVNFLDGLVMASNAFTSNGYAVLGNSVLGKIDSLFLVWGGYLLSGVGTATLTASILIRKFNKRFDELEELIKEKNRE